MKHILFYILFLIFSLNGFSQESPEQLKREAREHVRKGNKLYNQLKFSDAEVEYKKALSKDPNYPKASNNLGNALFQQDREKEAIAQYEIFEKSSKDKMQKATAFHNIGNSFLKQKQYPKAIEAYKNSLRNNSNDEETRYNLALAQKLLENQQQQNKNDKDKKGDNKDNKDKKKDDKGEDKKDEKKDDQKKDNKDQQSKKDDKKDPKKEDKQRPNQLTPEQIKQLLEAMNNEENKTQKKLNKKKAKGKKIRQEKDW